MGTKCTRVWLSPANSSSSQSYVMTDIEDGRGMYDDHSLTIADCNRNITLHFPADKKRRRAANAKLGRLYDALDRIAEVLEDDY